MAEKQYNSVKYIMLTMISINELRGKIIHEISGCLRSLGFTNANRHTFYAQSQDTIQVIEISFLDRRHAAYFGSNTASFSLELGIFFSFITPSENNGQSHTNQILLPKIFECHIRGNLLRDISQKAPSKDLSTPDKIRRDIWWIDRSGSNIDEVLDSATRVIRKRAKPWLQRFSDIHYTYRYLQCGAGKNAWQGGPHNLGAKGCPFRQKLMRHLATRLKSKGPEKRKKLFSR